ncbi:alpha/beta fold hydrolase [Pleionea mediterranea]|nr:alpha/beta hydrolase [Pleionea mediterranea]
MIKHYFKLMMTSIVKNALNDSLNDSLYDALYNTMSNFLSSSQLSSLYLFSQRFLFCLITVSLVLLTACQSHSPAPVSQIQPKQPVKSNKSSAASPKKSTDKSASRDKLSLPSSYFIQEPIFNTQIRVLEAGEPSANNILLIHGLGAQGADDWQTVIPYLAENFYVTAIDLPGFGQSGSTNALYSPENYARLLNWLVDRQALQNLTVIGHSMGAAIGLKFVADYPENVDKLIMIDSAGMLHRSVIAKHFLRVENLQSQLFDTPFEIDFINTLGNKINKASEWLLETADTLPDLTALLLNTPAARNALFKDKSSLNAALAMINEDFSDEVSRVNIPVHLIWGARDRVAPLRIGQTLEAKLSNAQLHIIANAGHNPMQETPFELKKVLLSAIYQAPILKQPMPKTIGQTNLNCEQKNKHIISGAYKTIVLDGCENVLLKNVTAERLIVTNQSRVRLTNVLLKNPQGNALTIEHSALEGTQVTIKAKQAIALNHAKLDLAAASVSSHSPFVVATGESTSYFSLSESLPLGLSQENRSGVDRDVRWLHGHYLLQQDLSHEDLAP